MNMGAFAGSRHIHAPYRRPPWNALTLQVTYRRNVRVYGDKALRILNNDGIGCSIAPLFAAHYIYDRAILHRKNGFADVQSREKHIQPGMRTDCTIL